MAALRDKGIVVVEYAEIRARFRPDVVGLGRMDMGIVPAGRGQDAVVVRGVGHLLADIDLAAIDDCSRRFR